MDAITRIQPTDPAAIARVNVGAMRWCATAVLVQGVTVHHLPAKVEGIPCAVTITVAGSPFTTEPVYATPEDDEDLLTTVALSRPGSVSATVTSATATTDCTRPSTAALSQRSPRRPSRTFKIVMRGIHLLFPGTRRTTSELGLATVSDVRNPREFAPGVQVTVHAADHCHIFGSALCKTSGEPALLSYPRGEASLDFRVYPCVDGVAMMQPLFLKECFANTYLAAAPAVKAPALGTADAPVAADGSTYAPAAEPVAEAAAEPAAEAAAEPAAEAAAEPVAEPAAEVEQEAVEGSQECAEPAEAPVPLEAAPPVDDARADQSEAEEEALPLTPNHSRTTMRDVLGGGGGGGGASGEDVALTAAVAGLVPCFTEAQRRAVFDLYDTAGTGRISRRQILHFIRSHAAYAAAYPVAEDLLREALKPYVTKDEDLTSGSAGTPVAQVGATATPGEVGEHGEVAAAAEEVEGEAAPAPEPGAVVQVPLSTAMATVGKPRLEVDHLYYRPVSASGHRAPLEIDYNLFSLISLKIAKV